VDPAAHTLTGAALAAAGLRRVSPLATAALLIGANVPDVDIVAGLAGPYASLAARRGWTHGVLAIALWPFLLTAALLLWDRWTRRREGRASTPARAGPLLAVAALAVVSHAALDWLNNYGIRLLMPFDRRWFYGDALFIVDPWVWLVLGGAVFLTYSRRPASLAAWAVFWLAATLLVLLAPQVPWAARGVWIAGLAVVVAARAAGVVAARPAGIDAARPAGIDDRSSRRMARLALALIAGYMVIEALANLPARAEIARIAKERNLGPVESIMIGPVPANPFGGTVVVETKDAYRLGRWSWLTRPHFSLDGRAVPKRSGDPVVEAASATLEARRFLTWSRFPYAEIETTPEGYVVRFADARYAGTEQLAGPAIRLDRALRRVDGPSAR
jgi:inner membrane protein